MSIKKLHLPNYLILLLTYTLALLLFSLLIVELGLRDSLLYLFIVPCILSAFFYSRWVSLSMLALLTGVSTWVTSLTSGNFEASLTSIAVAGLSGIIMTQVTHHLVASRKRAEQALAEKSMYLDNILRSATEYAIATTDLDFRVTYCNPLAERFLGYTAEEIIGKTVQEIHTQKQVTPECLEKAVENIRTHGEHRYRVVQEGDDGTHYLDFRASGIYDSDGELVGFALFSRDITERVRAEELARAQRDLGLALGAVLGLDEALRLCLETTIRISGMDCGGIYLVDETSGALDLVLYKGLSPDFVSSASHYEADSPTAQLVVAGQPVYSEHLQLGVPVDEVRRREALRAIAILPVRHEDRVIACLNIASHILDEVPTFAHTALEAIAAQVGSAVARMRVESQREAALEALRESEQQYRSLIEQSNDAIYLLYGDRFEIINPRFTELFGVTPEEARAPDFGFMSLVTPQSRPLIEERREKLAQGQELDSRYEFTAQDREGNEIEVEVSVSYIPYRDGTAVQGIIRDITERVRAEAEIARLATVIEQAAVTVVITDLEGDIVYANPDFETSTKYTVAEALGQNPRILKSDRQDASFYQELWDTITAGRTWNGVFVNKRKDGGLYHEQATIFPIRNAAGEIINYAAVKRDISERVRAEEEKAKLQEQLLQAQKMEAMGLLAGGVAHDFNNQLTVINGYAEFLIAELDEEDPRRADVEAIRKAAARSTSLTRQLLAFSRKQVIQPQVVNLNHLIGNVSRMLRRLIGEDIELVTILDPGRGQVKADPGQIEQVIVNLVVNARDAIKQVPALAAGKLIIETANVELDAEYARLHADTVPGPYVMLAVSDNGIGMNEETRSHLFEPFFTTKERGKGTGLGLATVYGIVKQSGGNVWVYSEPGEGTTFKVYLPRVDEATASAESKGVRPDSLQGSETILLVEDDRRVRALARRILQRQGYIVLEAVNAAEAVILSDEYQGAIHLLLTDVIVPGEVSIQEMIECLGARRPDMKVLYMSGYTDNAIVHYGVLDLGVNFIPKPFTADSLARVVREVLESE